MVEETRRHDADLVDESRAEIEERLAIERDVRELEYAPPGLRERRLTDLAFLIRVLAGDANRTAIAEMCLRDGATLWEVAAAFRQAFEADDGDCDGHA